ncbi:MAG: AbrB/MazE/SpoVT family DNA-binding domain-containing protein [Candidatus Kerfeldbacteria bacterium]|nr:AbrB/MazE/SpoVT family DNA-binding domain-containing protein [Candidatus Kerfeldbacteria bacterium]
MQQFQVTSVSSKGQVVIPNDMRGSLGITSGTKLLVLTDGINVLLKPIQDTSLAEFDQLIQASRNLVKKKLYARIKLNN